MREDLIRLGVDNKKMVTWTRGGNHGAFKNPIKRDLYGYMLVGLQLKKILKHF